MIELNININHLTKMEEKQVKRLKIYSLAVMLLCCIFGFTGCKEQSNIINSSEEINVTTGMGRYVEHEIEVPSQVEEGKLFVNQYGNICLFSKDTCEWIVYSEDYQTYDVINLKNTWNIGEADCLQIACSPSGEYVMEVLDEARFGSNDGIRNAGLLYLKENGDVQEIPILAESEYVKFKYIDFSSDGKLYGCDYAGHVYEISIETGKAEIIFSGSFEIMGFNVISDYIVATDRKHIYFYEMETETLLDTATVLDEFLQKQNLSPEEAGNEGVLYLFAQGEEGTIYIATINGLYRYIIGGETIEQLIKGNITQLDSPAFHMNSLICDDEGDFLVLFEEGKMLHYTFDETVPSVPEKTLCVYSLEDNETIRQAIKVYQAGNPNVLVEYEVGMEDKSITYEDAIKQLNVKILSEDAPDIIVLDGMSISTYVEKGILMDISNYQQEILGESGILENISNFYDTGNETYVMAAKFGLPILIMENESVAQGLNNLTDLKELTLETQQQLTDSQILGLYTAQEVIDTCMLTVGNNILTEENISEEALREMLTNAKDIYDSELSTLTETDIAYHMDDIQYDQSMYLNPIGSVLNIIVDVSKISLNKVSCFQMEFNAVNSMQPFKENSGYQFGLGEDEGLFFPTCILGICAGTDMEAEAVTFMKCLFSDSVQAVELGDGFSVCESVLEDHYNKGMDEVDDFLGAASCVDPDTLGVFVLEIYGPDTEASNAFDTYVHQLSMPFYMDKITEENITETGIAYLEGNMTLDEAVELIMERTELRLEE